MGFKRTTQQLLAYFADGQPDGSIVPERVRDLVASFLHLDVWQSEKQAIDQAIDQVGQELNGKQATLVSGENIKTVGGTSLLGAGNVDLPAGGGLTEQQLNDAIAVHNAHAAAHQDIRTQLDGKVPTSRTVAGKPLSSNVTLVKGDVGLGNVDNTSDAAKPISGPTQTALDSKQTTLVSGDNIKTINNESVLGAGNIESGGVSEAFVENAISTHDGDGASHPDKATKNISVVQVAGATHTLQASNNTKILQFDQAATLTIPAGLPQGMNVLVFPPEDAVVEPVADVNVTLNEVELTPGAALSLVHLGGDSWRVGTGTPGPAGDNGSVQVDAHVVRPSDGLTVRQIVGWFPENLELPTGQYIGALGWVEDIEDAVPIDGPEGPSGDPSVVIVDPEEGQFIRIDNLGEAVNVDVTAADLLTILDKESVEIPNSGAGENEWHVEAQGNRRTYNHQGGLVTISLLDIANNRDGLLIVTSENGGGIEFVDPTATYTINHSHGASVGIAASATRPTIAGYTVAGTVIYAFSDAPHVDYSKIPVINSHGADGTASRIDGQPNWWDGTVEPTNMQDGDFLLLEVS